MSHWFGGQMQISSSCCLVVHSAITPPVVSSDDKKFARVSPCLSAPSRSSKPDAAWMRDCMKRENCENESTLLTLAWLHCDVLFFYILSRPFHFQKSFYFGTQTGKRCDSRSFIFCNRKQTVIFFNDPSAPRNRVEQIPVIMQTDTKQQWWAMYILYT